MADLGAIGKLNAPQNYYKSTRTWTQSSGPVRLFGGTLTGPERRIQRSAITMQRISGIVRENGAVAARTVRAYRRDNGELLATTTSAGDGTYNLYIGYTGNVFVIAFDAAGAPVLNAAVFDYMVAA